MTSPEGSPVDASTIQPLVIFTGMLVCCIVSVGHILNYNFVRGPQAPSWGQKLAQLAWCAVILLLARLWLAVVTRLVPEPYLDEFFHVPQAQKYCEGRWFDWDDKITTPPGVYVLSLVFRLLGLAPECSTAALRQMNGIAIALITLVASSCRTMLEAQARQARGVNPGDQSFSLYSIHSAFNIALFPPLFFFSALYYTDVASALMVLACYQDYYDRRERLSLGQHSAALYLRTIITGVAALLMRQTNIFWVVIFMGGLEVVDAVKTLEPRSTKAPQFVTLSQMLRYYLWRYSLGDIHDPPVSYASPDDWALSLLSICTAALCNPFTVLKRVWPRIALLSLFAAFVFSNGGVVLGDKSNHVATLHLAQMLYIWPLFAFFSAPLLLSFVAQVISHASRILFPAQATEDRTWSTAVARELSQLRGPGPYIKAPHPSAATSYRRQKSPELESVVRFFESKQYMGLLIVGFHAAAFLVVRYNTIIHPFTLADNRHYMFYVFRYTVLRPGWTRYFLVPVYVFCARLCWSTLGGSCDSFDFNARASDCKTRRLAASHCRHINTPFGSPRMLTLAKEDETVSPVAGVDGSAPGSGSEAPSDQVSSATDHPPLASTALLWLLATALSLITAPLVEPRYFILPWVFWRLLVPAWKAHDCHGALQLGPWLWPGGLVRLGQNYDLCLLVETAWFLLINVATMYVFLLHPYQWKAADGSVMDGGKWQRFMW